MKAFKNPLFLEKTFRKWFMNSLLILFIFILSGIFLYLGSLYVTKRVLLIAQEQTTEHTKDVIDIKLYNLKKDISVLTLDERIISASYIKQPFTSNDYYNYHKAGKELTGIYSYKNVQNIYVYYNQGDCFVSYNSLIGSDHISFIENEFGMSRTEWKNFASKQLTSVFIRINGSVYFLCPLKRNGANEVTCLAVAELDEKDFKQLLPNGEKNVKNTNFGYLINSKNELITTTNHEAKPPFLYKELNIGENFIDENVVICKKIENADWEYISVVPLSLYLKEIYDLHSILYIYIGAIIILACCMVYFETRRRFLPVQVLTKNMSNLKSKFLVEKDKATGKKLSEMMGEHVNPLESGQYFRDYFSMDFKQGLAVIVKEMSSGEKLKGLSADELDNILLLCLNNIGTELYGNHHMCFFWRYVEITGIIWTDREDTGSYLYIKNVLEQIRTYIKEYFDVELRFALSQQHGPPSELSIAHNEAKAANDYSHVTGKMGVISYDESYTSLLTDWNDMDIIKAEQEFMDYMLEHNYKKAKSKLEMIIGYYGLTDGASIQLLKCRMFGLINLMLNAIEMDKSVNEEQFYAELNPAQRLLQATTIHALKHEIIDIIEAFILHYNEKEETTGKKLVYIDRYIEAHYMDYDLSVQKLSEKFNMSFTFLSKIYKQHNGIGVLEKINECRIKNVKKLLLEEPDTPLAHIAEKVGYSNVQTMLRVFKKIENQTPGQFRVSQD